MWKDREGKEVSAKEFMERWKQGINNISPLQLAKNERLGQLIMLLGAVWGFAFALINKQWWLCLILFGSLVALVVSLIGSSQKINTLSSIYSNNETEVKIQYV